MKELSLSKEIKLVLFSADSTTRTGLESMLSFGSIRVELFGVSNISRFRAALQKQGWDIGLLCICEVQDEIIKEILSSNRQLPLILIDKYYNRERANRLLKQGALDYLDMSTLDSRLLIKAIKFSIERHQADSLAIEAEQRMQIRSTFLANMSHEIRTPLNSIIGFSELLYDDEKDAVKREKLNMIRQSGKHLLTLINSILDFSKLEAGKINLNEEVFSIDNLVMNLYYMMLVKCGDRNLDLNIKPKGRIPDLVEGDKFRIDQILINLLNNAIKFTEEGSVTLEYSYNSSEVLFRVIDTGIGISEAHQKQIFGAFEQVTESGIPRKGTGLGLAISQNLVHLMQGRIELESKIGIGSVFSVSIPLPVIQWDRGQDKSNNQFNFSNRKLGIYHSQGESKEIIKSWSRGRNIEMIWAKGERARLVRFCEADIFLLPQQIEKEERTKLLNWLSDDPQTCFKPKVFYYHKDGKLYFMVDKRLDYSNYVKLDEKLIERNLTEDQFIEFLNSHFERLEDKGKELISIWNNNFEQENPGLEEVLFEALMRMREKVKELNKAARNNDYKQIEEIAHSLKGFTGQTCIYEVSNRANILLEEMRSIATEPHPDIIARELTSINEIIYLLPAQINRVSRNDYSNEQFADEIELPHFRILVAEDNSINQAVLRDFLNYFGQSCTIVENGKEAIDRLKEEEFDLIFIDIQMPVMSGITLLHELESSELMDKMFVVILSAYVLGVNKEDKDYLEKMSNAILNKPFEKKELNYVLQQAAQQIRPN